MIIINQSFLQLLILFLLSFKKRNNNFYIVFTEKPRVFIQISIHIFNKLSKNKYLLKDIYFLRNKCEEFSNQEIIKDIEKYHSIVFKGNKRSGGQIYIENMLRKYTWNYYSFDVLIKDFFYQNIKKEYSNHNEEIFKILNNVREYERKIYNRFFSFRCSIGFIFLIIRNIIQLKIHKSLSKKINKEFLKKSSFTIHNFEINTKYQEQDLIIDAIKFLSKDLHYEKVINEIDFLYFISSKIANQKKIINFQKIYFLFLKLIFKFFTSNQFLQDCSNFLDRLVSILLADIILTKEFKVLCIDPIEGKSIPILFELKSKGFLVAFTSFSTGTYYTSSYSDYNGPYNCIFSQNKGFTEIVKKSQFRGKIVETKCYLSLFNNSLIDFKKLSKENKSYLNVIVPDIWPAWYMDQSKKEVEEFSKLIEILDSKKIIKLTIKKKKMISLIENYLDSNCVKHNILFKPPIRGYMGDFLGQDYIISLGLSSLGEKAAENFGIEYIIFDDTERSKLQWQNFYSRSKVKPLFARNLDDIEKYLNYKKF